MNVFEVILGTVNVFPLKTDFRHALRPFKAVFIVYTRACTCLHSLVLPHHSNDAIKLKFIRLYISIVGSLPKF